MTKKIFFMFLVLGYMSTHLLFAADDKRKGFSFYSKKQPQSDVVQTKVEEKIIEKVADKVEIKAEMPKQVVGPAKAVNETLKAEVKEKAEVREVEVIKEAPVVMTSAQAVAPAAVSKAPAHASVSAPAPVAASPVKEVVAEKAPVKISSEAQAHQDNLNALLQRLANNKSMTDVEKTSLAETMISQSPKAVDFRSAEQEKNVLFFESTGNDPNMTVEQKKQALKKGPVAPPTEDDRLLTVGAKVGEVSKDVPKEAPKEAPKKHKFF